MYIAVSSFDDSNWLELDNLFTDPSIMTYIRNYVRHEHSHNTKTKKNSPGIHTAQNMFTD